MEILTAIALMALMASLLADRKKTWIGIIKGLMMFLRLLPAILVVLILVSVLLFIVPNDLIVKYLGENAGFTGYLVAAIVGSIALMPGFIAYPLAGILVHSGVSYPVIAVFITTLMMVGVLTLPVEIKYFGTRISLIRNALFLAGALIVGGLIGLFFVL